VLLWCCAFYFICSGILQLLLSFVELEAILFTKGKRDSTGKRGPGLNVSSHFPRFQEVYTLGITPLPRGSIGLAWSAKFKPQPLEPGNGPRIADGVAQQQWLVSDFFDDEGFFHEEPFLEEARAFVKEYEESLLKKSK